MGYQNIYAQDRWIESRGTEEVSKQISPMMVQSLDVKLHK